MIKKYDLQIKPAIKPKEREKIEKLLIEMGYDIIGGGNKEDMSGCGILFFKDSFKDSIKEYIKAEKEKKMIPIACAKCGKTVKTTEDEDYNKALPKGWELKTISIKGEPHNPIKFVICDECIKKEKLDNQVINSDEEKALKIAVDMAIGFCVNVREKWVDWENYMEIGELFARLTFAKQDPSGFLEKYEEGWKTNRKKKIKTYPYYELSSDKIVISKKKGG